VLGKDVLTRLRDYVIAHIDEPNEVSTLAKIVGRSPLHFTRLFTRFVGVSPHRYVVHLRWQRAVELVRHVRSGLADVAVRTGFADQSHLTRWVRRVHGVSLTELVARAQRAGIFKISGSLFPKSRSRGAELPRSRRQTRKNNMTDLIERRFHRLGTQLSGLSRIAVMMTPRYANGHQIPGR